MAELNLNGQAGIAAQVGPKLVQLREALEQRLPVWQKLTAEQKRRWLAVAAERDPLLHMARQMAEYLMETWFDGIRE